MSVFAFIFCQFFGGGLLFNFCSIFCFFFVIFLFVLFVYFFLLILSFVFCFRYKCVFPQRVWQWKDEYGGKITNQIRKLGSSVDWSREAFTMDANLSREQSYCYCYCVPGMLLIMYQVVTRRNSTNVLVAPLFWLYI